MAAVSDQADIDEEGVRHIRQQRLVQSLAIGYRARGLHPGLQHRLARHRIIPVHRLDNADIQVLTGGDHKALIQVASVQAQLTLIGE